MALPTILVNSATGSDTQASGAGPTTALFGSAGVTSADGLTVSLLTDNPDLSGVATDGSAVIFMSDTAAGARNFGKITAVDNTVGVKTVTVANAFGLTNTDAWAIGGKRASIGSTTSAKLFTNNSGNGDWLPGWTVEMESGHTETIAAQFNLRRVGDATDGPMTLRGTVGAATPPILTFSHNGTALRIDTSNAFVQLRGFELRNSNATKTASIGISSNGSPICVSRVKISHATNKFWKGTSSTTTSGTSFYDCDLGNCANVAVDWASPAAGPLHLQNCWIHDNGSHGVLVAANGDGGVNITDCLITDNASDGINFGARAGTGGCFYICNNTIDGNTGDGIDVAAGTGSQGGLTIRNNNLTNNGNYGVRTGSTAAALNFYLTSIDFNNTYNNTSGAYDPSGYGTNDPGLDPQYTNAASNDFSIGTNLKAKGFPDSTRFIGANQSATKSYVDIGAAQRQEAGSGGGGPLIGPGRLIRA